MGKFNYFLFVFVLFILTGCSKEEEDIVVESETNKVRTISTYKGIAVVNRLNTPIVDNEGSIGVLSKRKRELESVSFDDFSLDVIVSVVEEELAKFPYITEKEGNEERLKFLNQDFPTLTPDDIQENIAVIENYYHKSLDYLVLDRLSKIKKTNSVNKSMSSDGYGSEQVNCLKSKGVFKSYGGSLGSNALALAAFFKASEAQGIARNEYPNLSSGDTKQDTYRHILWNALLCRYYYTVSSKAPKLSYATAIGNAWEVCGENAEDASLMDYHNNAIGRWIYDHNTPYETFLGWAVGLKTPSVDLLKRKTKEVVENAFLVTGTKEERAEKIRTKKFNCTTKYIKKQRRYRCREDEYFERDGSRDIGAIGAQGAPGDGDDRYYECWEVYYEPYQSCNSSVAVYLSVD